LTAERILARRDHGREELRRKLLKRGFAPPDVDALLARLTAAGYLDDGKYAESLKRFELGRGHGLNYVSAKLRQRGLRMDRSPEDLRAEAASLRQFLEKKGWEAPSLTRGPEGAKILRFLRGRGYTSASLGAVLNGPEPDDTP
jgi:regulatory protein